jgi:phosphotransferase system IIB component
MSGLEVLAALSATLSVVRSTANIIDIIYERREFEHYADKAFDTAELLRWQWDQLKDCLDIARQEGLDESLLVEHIQKMDNKLLEALDLVKELVNRDKTANIKIILGFGTAKLKRVNSSLEYLVRHLQAMDNIFMRFV